MMMNDDIDVTNMTTVGLLLVLYLCDEWIQVALMAIHDHYLRIDTPSNTVGCCYSQSDSISCQFILLPSLLTATVLSLPSNGPEVSLQMLMVRQCIQRCEGDRL
jgi:hypothetical protein